MKVKGNKGSSLLLENAVNFFQNFQNLLKFEVRKNTLPRMSTDAFGHARLQESSHSSFYGEVKSFIYEDLPCCV